MAAMAGLPTRPTPFEWALIVAMVLVIGVALLPRLVRGAVGRNHHHVAVQCLILARAENELALKGLPYASPAVLAGSEPYRVKPSDPGLRLSFLSERWRGLDPEEDLATPFGYRFGFFIDDERRRWAMVAWPQRWGEDGERAFAVTQDREVRSALPPENAPWEDKRAVAAAAWGDPDEAASAANGDWEPGWEPWHD